MNKCFDQKSKKFQYELTYKSALFKFELQKDSQNFKNELDVYVTKASRFHIKRLEYHT